jgi:hypothetical protein
MDHLLQIAGLPCAACGKSIASLAEGSFCGTCCNPLHNNCKPAPGTPVADDRCDECGVDPQDPRAVQLRAEMQEELGKGPANLLCPGCGSTRGFKPYRSQVDATPELPTPVAPIQLFFLVAFFQVLAGLFNR